jgi:carotenoid cleavage dioxygenase
MGMNQDHSAVAAAIVTAPTRRLDSAPIHFEADADWLPVVGTLPAGLNGTLYRNGPNPQFPSAKAHIFGGDGMLHAFTLDNGRAGYRNRWVRTSSWQAEHAAGRRLADGFGIQTEGAGGGARVPDQGVANTNIVSHAGRLMALEEGHLPIAIEPGTLATLGPIDFEGKVNGPFTAHPKLDPETGELLFFGYGSDRSLGAGMTFGILDAAGRPTRFDAFEAPYASMVHDFAVTSGHVVFPVMPLTASIERARSGRPPFAWEPALGARIGIMPRTGSVAAIRWFEADAGYVFHVMNAWEEHGAGGLRIIADVMRFDEPPLFPHPDGRPTDPRRSVARLYRWTFDLGSRSDTFQQQLLDDRVGEFPRIDDRRAGLAYRHGWFSCQREPVFGAGREGIAHIDVTTGRRESWFATPGDRVSEPVFVACTPGAAEGDGWLLATVFRAAECRSDLALFDASAVADGPVALVHLAHRVPAGFHGNWVAAS